jgi:hypothetical protein
MKVTYTDAGTPVIERTVEEYEAHLERQVQREVGMSVAEFTKAYLAGKLDCAKRRTGTSTRPSWPRPNRCLFNLRGRSSARARPKRSPPRRRQANPGQGARRGHPGPQ